MKLLMSLALLILPICGALAGTTVSDLQHQWEVAYYQTPDAEVETVFDRLVEQVDAAVAANPDDAGLCVWQGIIKSSYAGKRGGLSALGLVKEARDALERAIKLDGTVLHGSAYTSLGALYYQVPGWPIAFGDRDKARELLQQGLSFNPDGLDSNYFYADFLFRQKDYKGASEALQRAEQAAPRPGRELADQGRRKEMAVLQEKIRNKLSG